MKKKRNTIVIFLIILPIVIVVMLLATYGYQFYQEYQGNKVIKTKGIELEIEIPKGSGTQEIGEILKDNELIKFKWAFVLRVKNSQYNGKLRYGEFNLNDSMSLDEILEILCKTGAKKESLSFTIPEGYSLEMIANKLDNEGICTNKEFLEAVQKDIYEYDFLESIPDNEDIKYRLQGFLFPSTYEVYKDSTAEDIINKMLEKFQKEWNSEYNSKAKELGYSIYEMITMASIIEKETKLDEERATVAGVILNRLNSGMKLQIDATTLYAITDGLYNVKRVLYSDLETKSPYNTYYCEGLPVGAICNPGIDSINAIFYPEHHKYFYYHTDDEEKGNHIFTETYEEHKQTIKK